MLLTELYGLPPFDTGTITEVFELQDRFNPECQHRVHIYLDTGAILLTRLISTYEEASYLVKAIKEAKEETA